MFRGTRSAISRGADLPGDIEGGQSDSAALIIAARSGPVDYLGMVRALLPSLGSGDIVQDAKLLLLEFIAAQNVVPKEPFHAVVGSHLATANGKSTKEQQNKGKKKGAS